MRVEITYPPVEKRRERRRRVLDWTKRALLLSAYGCLAVNLAVGGRAWSIVAVLSLYMVWTLLLSPSLVEYNRISQFIKWMACACILLAAIDLLLSPGWAVTVVPLVCFGALVVSGVLFFTDLERQKQNMLPMLLLIALAVVGAVVGLCVRRGANNWAFLLMGGTGLVLLAACGVTLGRDFLRELRKRFHVK